MNSLNDSDLDQELGPPLALFPPMRMAEQSINARASTINNTSAIPLDFRRLREVQRIVVGFHEVLGEIYDRIGYDGMWRMVHTRSARIFRQEVLMSLLQIHDADPIETYEMRLDTSYMIPDYQLYHMMKLIDEKKHEKIRKLSLESAVYLIDSPIDEVFCHAIPLPYYICPDELQGGKVSGKDSAANRKISATLILQTSADSLPLDYRLIPCDISDFSTIFANVTDMRKSSLQDAKTVFVSEAEHLADSDLQSLTQAGIDYIVQAHLPDLPPEIAKRVCNTAAFAKDAKGRKVQEMTSQGRRLLVARCKRKTSDNLSSTRDKRFDWVRGLWTNMHEAPAVLLRNRYADMERFDDHFSLKLTEIKNNFKPTYQLALAHVAINFCALVIIRNLMRRLHDHDPDNFKKKEQQVLYALSEIRSSVIKYQGSDDFYMIPSATYSEHSMIYKALLLPLPTHLHEFPNYTGSGKYLPRRKKNSDEE